MDERTPIQDEIAREEARLAELDRERGRLSDRIAGLKGRLSAVENSPTQGRRAARPASPLAAAAPSTSAEKTALFMSLFRGRDDVYPKLWVSARKGTKGYSPACGNEWVRGLCGKPRVKCGECPNQAFVPVTRKTVHDHFQGRHTAGVYPMLLDETCWFLAVDFDKGQWRDDVAAFSEACAARGVPHAVERSRSGDGAHVWFFFAAPVSAGTARQMGCLLVTEAMASRHQLPMTSYDRFFPNQDTMPKGGFGNLIALPFQDGPRQQGNSVFVDPKAWTPHPDQWAFLASVRRLQPAEVEALAREGVRKGQIIGVRMGEPAEDREDARPWTRPPSRRRPKPVITGPLPDSVAAVLSQQLFVETDGLPPALVNQVKRLAAFQNPEFYRKQAMRLSTALTPRVISCAEDRQRHVALPRGCATALEELLSSLGVALAVEDRRMDGEKLDVRFRGELTPVQERAAQALAMHDFGVLVAPAASGKTVVGADLIARRRRNTLVLVHRTQLLEQWMAQLALFLDLKPDEIGQIGGGKRRPNGSLDVAMIQSLAKKDVVDDIVAAYGHVIVDECHHVPAVSFERVMREVKARHVAGLTATPRRRDGIHPILEMQLGPIRHTIDAKSQAAARPFRHKLIVRETGFRLAGDGRDMSVQEVFRELAQDEGRNRLIIGDVARALREGRSPLLLTERRDHLECLARHLTGLARNLIVLHGGMKATDRRAAVQRLASMPESEVRLVLATGRFIGEGFDDSRLDTLFLAMPVSWKGTLVQYAGRIHRLHRAKTEVRMMDYVDRDVPMLARMFNKRMRVYRAMNYAVGDCVAEPDRQSLHHQES